MSIIQIQVKEIILLNERKTKMNRAQIIQKEKFISNIKNEIEQSQRTDIENIINALFEHHIAQNDTHYEFLKQIEQSLREYLYTYF